MEEPGRHFCQDWALAYVPAWAPGDLPVLESAWNRLRGVMGLPREVEPRDP